MKEFIAIVAIAALAFPVSLMLVELLHPVALGWYYLISLISFFAVLALCGAISAIVND